MAAQRGWRASWGRPAGLAFGSADTADLNSARSATHAGAERAHPSARLDTGPAVRRSADRAALIVPAAHPDGGMLAGNGYSYNADTYTDPDQVSTGGPWDSDYYGVTPFHAGVWWEADVNPTWGQPASTDQLLKPTPVPLPTS